MNKKNFTIAALVLSISQFITLPSSAADLSLPPVAKEAVVQQVNTLATTSVEYKKELMEKLSHINQFSAVFEQEIIDNEGNILQTGGGDLAVKRPNLVHWNTTSPDESLIVSDGESIFLFDPFIEQVTAYKLDGAIANTPILLITSNDTALWEQYSVSRSSANNYVIHANDVNSRIKTLEINFNDKSELSGFTFLDVTGQLSKVSLNNMNLSTNLDPSLFTFTIPEGAHLDDQR
ncbi:outer membrane lipoprotein chaperone LolA [Pseudocolwellia sp. HL-MZ19]|uniref:outer membrane lipoprotein chaperone LolA n=1 Tax=unclassified Pseudocolwellia TaxID=2848178 RepID=UPI003CECCC59